MEWHGLAIRGVGGGMEVGGHEVAIVGVGGQGVTNRWGGAGGGHHGRQVEQCGGTAAGHTYAR